MKRHYQAVALFLLSYTTLQLTSPKTVSPNQRFINTGVCTVDTTNTYNNASAANWNPLQFTVTYATSLGKIQKALVLISIKDMHVFLSGSKLQFYGKQGSITKTSFVLSVYSNLTNTIQVLSYRYLIVTNDYYNYNNTMGYRPATNISMNISSASPLTKSFSVFYLNLTGGVVMVIFFLGFDVQTSSAANVIDLSIAGKYTSQYDVTITLQSTSNVPLYIGYIYFSWFVYNKGFFIRQNFSYFSTQKHTLTGSSFTFNNPYYLYQPNTFIGLNSVRIKGESFLDSKMRFNSPNSFDLTSTNNNGSFVFSSLYLLTFYCRYSTPYFSQTDSLCYDICPIRTYSDLYSMSCLNCLYDCYSCNGTTGCLSCSDADHRVLSSSTSRCVPLSGYYQANKTVCQPCSIACISCQTATKCNICSSGYYLSNSSSCQICPNGCNSCSSSQDCSSSSNIGLIIGIAVGVLIVVLIALKIVHSCYQKVKSGQQSSIELGYVQPQVLGNSQEIIGRPLNNEVNNSFLSNIILPSGENELIPVVAEAIPAVQPVVEPVPVVLPSSAIIQQVGVWCDRANQIKSKQECVICYLEHTYLRLECKHFFHIKCIADWSKKGNSCPLCRKQLTDKNHRLYCRLCRSKEKLISFEDLLQSYKENRYEKEVLCNDCRQISA